MASCVSLAYWEWGLAVSQAFLKWPVGLGPPVHISPGQPPKDMTDSAAVMQMVVGILVFHLFLSLQHLVSRESKATLHL